MVSRTDLRRGTHARVLDAAESLFLAQGFRETTVRGIADAASVSVGTVMGIGDKNTLLVTIYDRHIEQRLATFDPPEPGGRSCAEDLAACVRPYLDLFAARPELSRTWGAVLATGAHPSGALGGLAPVLGGQFGTILRAHGCAPPARVEPLAHALFLSYIGVLYSWAASGSDDGEGLRTLMAETFAALTPCGAGATDASEAS